MRKAVSNSKARAEIPAEITTPYRQHKDLEGEKYKLCSTAVKKNNLDCPQGISPQPRQGIRSELPMD